eukprot:NODE_605_length_6197_cov_0.280092.p2 type:complete len:500 gc:universal NODE_605_length_6197_cov_0.280092:2421-3920(+)
MSRSRNDIFLQPPIKVYPTTIEAESVEVKDKVIIAQPVEKPKRSEIRKRAEALIERSSKPIGLLDTDRSVSPISPRNRSKSSSNVQQFVSFDQISKFSANPIQESLDLVYLPIKKNLLGEGRHANVYSGYLRFNKTVNNNLIQGPELQCAVKVFNNEPDSENGGLMEAYCLDILKHHHNIIQLYGFMEYKDTPGQGTKYIEINLEEMRNINPDVFMNHCKVFDTELLYEIPDETYFIDFSHKKHRLLVIEYAKCGTLWSLCQKTPRLIQKRLFLRWAKELASALILIQEKNIIHHDIKPGNVLLGEFNVTKLSDFGNSILCTPHCCKIINDKFHLPITASRGRGTTVYQAPELFSKDTTVYDNSIDMYSFGAALWATGILGKEPWGKIQNVAMLHQLIQRGFLLNELNWPPEMLHSELQDCEISAVFPDKINIKDAKGIYNPYNGRVLRFLNGEVVDVWIYELLRDCLSPRIEERPTPKEFLYRIKLNDGGLDATDFFL